MPSKEYKRRQKQKENARARRSKVSAELATTTTGAMASTSGLNTAPQIQPGSSTQNVTATSAEAALTLSEATPKGMRRTHSKILQDEQSIRVPPSPLTPASKRPCDIVFDFPNTHNDEHASDDDETLELPVAADCIAVNKGGHPLRTPSHNPRGRKSDTERSTGKRTPLLATANTSNLRLLPKLKSRHVELIEQRMRDIKLAYSNRKWLPKNENNRTKKEKKCSTGCSCAKCYLDADAYIKASDYIAQHREDDDHFVQEKTGKLGCAPTGRCHLSPAEAANKNLGCAANSSNHQVPYYDSGTFGDRICPFCNALLLEREYQQYKRGRKTICCNNGECCTGPLWKGWRERQDPPVQLLELINEPDKKKREEFLNNTMPLNNTFAFASVHAEKAPSEQMGGRMDTCKYNGEFSFCFSDLIAPEGKRPTFAQVYTLTSEEAQKLRPEHFTDALHKRVSKKFLIN